MTPPIPPPYRRVKLPSELTSQAVIVFYAPTLDDDGRRKVVVKIRDHESVELTLLPSGLVHWQERQVQLAPIADSLQVPVNVLAKAISEHADPD